MILYSWILILCELYFINQIAIPICSIYRQDKPNRGKIYLKGNANIEIIRELINVLSTTPGNSLKS